ncbi:hypothetical protein [uncultured Treponema sp.]|uniref:hypothetical protein n=1 Tax=uncultured Treponema sp. TaxID=162155 RepID=UPI0025D48153|nr:hypothetical protein [uncultured Treponema sp.]
MKKSQVVLGVALTTAALALTSCGSTQNVSTEVSKDIRATASENNTSIAARKTEIIDWQDRTIGAKVNPEWLLGITRGNGNMYVQMYGLSNEYANHKWFVSSAQNRTLANAETIAQTEIYYNLAAEMANTINATVGTNLTNGQKDAIRTICSKVNNVTLTGVGNRGSYWQLERTADEYGNIVNLYNYYAIYSCDSATYNMLLNVYMIDLLKSKDLDEATVNVLKQNAQQILNNAQKIDEQHQLAKEREWKAQLVHEQTQRIMAHEETNRQVAASAAEAAKGLTQPFQSVNVKTTDAPMDPALAALIGAM